MTAVRQAARLSALARCCHPMPTAAVTCFAVVLAAAAGNSVATCVVLAVAVFAGQLSIGWSNDLLDAARDRQVDRSDKPLATGELSHQIVERAIGAAVVVTVAFSLALGWRAGLLHLAAVGCGWLYNVWLKSTWWSWLPYAAAFGALPGVATLALPGHPGPAGWAVAAGALFGVAAHLTNTLPDLAGDRATGIAGLPHRIGARTSLLLAFAVLVAATVCVTIGPAGPVTVSGWVALGFSVAVGLTGMVVLWSRPTSRWSFYGIVAVVGFDLILIVTAGHHLH